MAFLAGAMAGGAIAEGAKLLTKRAKFDFGRTVWVGVVYGIIGMLVDILYQCQAQWFGHGNDIFTLSRKMAFDMFIFTPFLSFPLATSLIGWWKDGFTTTFWQRALTWKYYRSEVVPTMPLGWVYWIPVVLLTYALPLPVQFPFAILAEAAWCVMFVFMIAGE